MAILDDLKGVLSADEFSKLESDPALKTRLTRGDELRSFYDGEETTTTSTTSTVANTGTTETTRSTPANQFDLSAIESMFDRKIGKLDERIDSRFNTLVEQKGNELVNNAVKISIQRADELNRIYAQHHQDFGTPFDSKAFNDFLEKDENKSRFRTITEAYDAMTADARIQKKLDAAKAEGKAEAVAARSGGNVPGTTPVPATHGNIVKFLKRGSSAEGAPATGAQRAATALDNILARRNEAAS